MRRHGSHDLIPTSTCLLGVSPLQETITKTSLWDESDDVLIIALPQSDSVEVRRVMFTEDEHDLIDEEGDSDLSDTDLQETHVGQMSFRVSASSFWQIHEQAPEILVQEVLQGLQLSAGDHVMDLYCGAGLFTKFIADKVGPLGSVIGIESSQSAVEDATRNLVEYPWTYIQHASVNKRSIAHASPLSTHAVLDPPRSGNDRSALLALNDLEHLRRIVSVSCDPATFARDLRILVDLGWDIVSLRAFDLFPMTEHLECTAVLGRSIAH
jgi:tRNA/tmRNA/rRNA uracil-C5-methylase (TrmA/RlmC/RlmD family)